MMTMYDHTMFSQQDELKMNKALRLGSRILYGVCLLLAAVFLIQVGVNEQAELITPRHEQRYSAFTDYQLNHIPDPTAPAGLRDEYTWTLPPQEGEGISLALYAMHRYIDIYLDDSLVLSFHEGGSNRFTHGTSGVWLSLPLTAEDYGRTVKVVSTPIYENVIQRPVEFYVGSRSALYNDVVQETLPTLLLSMLCMLVGLALLVAWLCYLLSRGRNMGTIFHLAAMLLFIGVSRICGMKSTSILFPGYSVLCGYASNCALLLTCLSFLRFIHFRSPDYDSFLIDATELIQAALVLLLLLLQLSGISELKDGLPLLHIMIFFVSLVVGVASYQRMKHVGTKESRTSFVFGMLLTVGIYIDLFFFYYRGVSRSIFAVQLVFLIYTFVVCFYTLRDMNQMAFTDRLTGLYTKEYWDFLRSDPVFDEQKHAVIMMDLNNFKQINDLYGHKEGDRMLTAFANILRSTVPRPYLVFRRGGDEFIILLPYATQEDADALIGKINRNLQDYNQSNTYRQLSTAYGYALATEHPELDLDELLELADHAMYENKQQWYRAQESEPQCV